MKESGTRARALNDERTRQAATLSKQLIVDLWAAIRVARYHSIDNEAVHAALERLVGCLRSLFSLQYDVSVVYHAKDFHVNELRIRAGRETFQVFASFADDLQKRQVGRLHFTRPPDVETLAGFVAAYNETSPGEGAYVDLTRRLSEEQITGLRLDKYTSGDLGDLPVIDKATFVRQSYFRAIGVVKQLYDEARERRPLTLRLAKRVVQNFVDVVLDEDSAHSEVLFLLTDVKNWHGYLFNHAVNTAILSIGTGHLMGLDPARLRELGTAALLADIGNAALPSEPLDAPLALSDSQRRIQQMHPIRGVTLLASFQDLDSVLIRTVITCLSHHRGYDGGGYPHNVTRTGDLLAEITSVCDRYDAMTTPRPWRATPLSPPAAVRALTDEAGKDLNPIVVKAFVQFMGALPAGTVVLLRTGEVGLVIGSGRRIGSEDALRVRILDPAGGDLDRDALVDIRREAEGSNDIQHVVSQTNPKIELRKAQALLGAEETSTQRQKRKRHLVDRVYDPKTQT